MDGYVIDYVRVRRKDLKQIGEVGKSKLTEHFFRHKLREWVRFILEFDSREAQYYTQVILSPSYHVDNLGE